MTRKVMALASVLVVATMALAALVAGSMLPSDLQLPIHWGIDGQPDSFAAKWIALFAPVGMVLAVSLLFHFLPVLEPRREGLARSEGLHLWGWTAVLMTGAATQIAILSGAFDWDVSVPHLVIGSVGVMMMMIGNKLGKSRRMVLMGVRTPWTLASEEVWIKTHRLTGKLMVAGGAAMAGAALLPLSPALLSAIAVTVIVAAVGVPVAYSYVAWRRERDADQASL